MSTARRALAEGLLRPARLARRLLPVLAAILVLLSAFPLPAAAEAGQFNPPHSDYGRDTDAPPDGLFNQLIVNVSLTITSGGLFLVDGALYAPDDTYLAYASASRTLANGNHVVPLAFNGMDLAKKGKDGPYRVDLGLWDKSFNRLATGTHYTKPYRAADFQTTPAHLSPPHADQGVDVDGNGKFEFLALDARVQVNRTASLTVKANLYNAAETVLIDQRTVTAAYDPGTRTVRLNFLGVLIAASGINGPYFARLWLYDAQNTLLSSGTYTTRTYASTDFEAPPATLAPPHSDRGLDLNANALWDYLAVDAVLNVVRPGRFTVEGELWEDAPTNPAFLTFTGNTTDLAPGTRTVRLHFLGGAVRDAGVGGRYQTYLRVMDVNGTALSTGQHLTGNYNVASFDPMPAQFAPPHADAGIDTNGNGKYDVLAVSASIAVRLRLAYRVPAFLFNGPGTTLIDQTENTTILNPGARAVPLWFDGLTIYNSTFGGPYRAQFQLYDPFGNLMHLGNHTTAAYARADFEAWVLPDTTPPVVTDVRGSPDPGELGGSVTVSARITDDRGVAQALANVTGPLGPVGSFPMAYDPGSGRYATTRTYGARGGYAVAVWAADDAGNEATGSGAFTVIDTIPPTVMDAQADPDPQMTGGAVNVSVLAADLDGIAWALLEVVDPLGGLSPGAMALDPATGRRYLERTYTLVGVHAFTVTASDPSGNVATATGQFTILAAPDTTPPTIESHAAAPDPQEPNRDVRLSARVTDDVGVDAVWVEVTLPSGGPLGNLTMAFTAGEYVRSVSSAELGVHPYCVWAEDGSGNGARACGSFRVRDATPPAIGGVRADPTTQERDLAVNVSAHVSDNVAVRDVWLLVRRPDLSALGTFPMARDPVSGRHFFVRAYSDLGVHTFEIGADDTSGNAANATGSFLIRDATPPAVTATAAPNPVEYGDPVTVSATATDASGIASVMATLRDPSGGLVGVFPMAPQGGDAYAYAHTPAALGGFTFTATARDVVGNEANASGAFEVWDTTAPAAAAGADQRVDAGTLVAFDGTGSTDAHGVANFTWTLADGGPVTLYGATASWRFDNPGTFDVTLTVRDTSGNWGTDALVVTVDPVVEPPVPSPPKAPTGVTATAEGTDAARVAWTAPTEREDGTPLATIAGFILYRSDGGPFAPVHAGLLAGTEQVDAGLARGVTYRYAVTAVDDGGRESVRSAEASVRIAPPGSILGRVVDEGGFPLGNATGVLLDGAAELARTATSPEGWFSFADVEAGAYTLHISREGYEDRNVPVSVVSGAETNAGAIALRALAAPPGEGLPGWLVPVVAILAVLAVAILLAAARRRWSRREGNR